MKDFLKRNWFILIALLIQAYTVYEVLEIKRDIGYIPTQADNYAVERVGSQVTDLDFKVQAIQNHLGAY